AVVAEHEAVEQREEAVKQKDIANQQRGIAEEKREEADQQRSIADQKRVEADQQRNFADQKRQEADQQRGLAEKAKQAEEYESYVARIGLAAAKINDNAFDYALDLLQDCKPELRNWEWGRLVHLCRLGAGSYAAAGPVDAVAYSPDGRQIASG